MVTKYIDRKTKEVHEEKSPKGANFLYKSFLGRIVLTIANKRFVSIIGGFYLNRKLSTIHIKKFIRDNKINMDEYPKVKYKSFNEFFSREIKEGKRKFSEDPKDFCAPCDSKLLVYKIDDNKEFIIKNKTYTVDSILRNKNLAGEFRNGYMFVFRLAVNDYHRYSYIDDGVFRKSKKIIGKFHTVGPIAFKRYKVFEENQREYVVLKTNNFSNIVQMEVGAMMVGKIVNYEKKEFKRGEEKGYFLFGGSTVIIMTKKDVLEVDKDILENSNNGIETKVKMGEKIARSTNDI